MYQLDPNSLVPIYLQIEQQTIKYIMLDILKPHQILPSVRNLSKQLGINPNTVQKAYQELEKQGYIYLIAGKGAYIADSTESKSVFTKDMKRKFQQHIRELHSYGVSKEMILDTIRECFMEVENDSDQSIE